MLLFTSPYNSADLLKQAQKKLTSTLQVGFFIFISYLKFKFLLSLPFKIIIKNF